MKNIIKRGHSTNKQKQQHIKDHFNKRMKLVAVVPKGKDKQKAEPLYYYYLLLYHVINSVECTMIPSCLG